MRSVVADPAFSWGIIMVSFVLACFDLISLTNFSLYFNLMLEMPCFMMLDVYLLIGS